MSCLEESRFSFFSTETPNVRGVINKGNLLKKGKVNKSWRQRYFVLYDTRKLMYWCNELEYKCGKEPINCIQLNQINSISIVDKKPKKLNAKTFNSKHYSIKNAFKMDKKNKNNSNNNNNGNNNLDDDGKADSLLDDEDIYIDWSDTNHYFPFELKLKNRTYLLCCDHAHQFNRWVNAIQQLSFGKPAYKGWMVKQGNRCKTWKTRWFIIYDTKEMRYYENETRKKPKGSIMLYNLIKMIKLNDNNVYNKTNIMELHTLNRIWVLQCNNIELRNIWFKNICDILKYKCQSLTPILNQYIYYKKEMDNELYLYKYCVLTNGSILFFENEYDYETIKNNAYFEKLSYNKDVNKYCKTQIKLGKTDLVTIIIPDQKNNNNGKVSRIIQISNDIDSYILAFESRGQCQQWCKNLAKYVTVKQNRESISMLEEKKDEYREIIPSILNSQSRKILIELSETKENKIRDYYKLKIDIIKSDLTTKTKLLDILLGKKDENSLTKSGLKDLKKLRRKIRKLKSKLKELNSEQKRKIKHIRKKKKERLKYGDKYQTDTSTSTTSSSISLSISTTTTSDINEFDDINESHNASFSTLNSNN